MRHLMKRATRFLALLTVLLFGGFCLITNTTGSRRIYLNSQIPFVYNLNNSVPQEYIAPIEASHMTWNDVPGSFWEFSRGPNTAASSVGQDGVNLVFFDLAGVNFPPPTSVIAFSSTFTTNSGGFHATESDLVWNARDFPPSPIGASGQQDLQSVLTHEFGHHLGLDHTGLPGGASSGCGPQVQPATMWWSSANGDTTKRSLHPEDVMGVCVLYPSWRLDGSIVDGQGQAASGVPVWFRGTTASVVGPVENPIGTRYNRSGYLLDTVYTDAAGLFSTVVIDQDFDIVVDGFGYERDSSHVHFNPAGGIGQTEVLTRNFQLQATPLATVSGFVRNATTQAGIHARVQVFGTGDPQGMTAAVTTQPDGGFTVSLPSKESYRIMVFPDAPYQDVAQLSALYLQGGGATVNFDLTPAAVLIVDDDAGAAVDTTFQSSCDRLQIVRRTFSIADSGATPEGVLATFPTRPCVIWSTGWDSTNAFTLQEKRILIAHLAAGGSAIITGNNIGRFTAADDTLLARTLGIRYSTTVTPIFVRGFVGDIIGNGINYSVAGGPGGQGVKENITLDGGGSGTPTKTLYYATLTTSDTTSIAAARIVGPGGSWAATYFCMSLAGFTPARQDTFIARSLRFFAQSQTGVSPAGPGVPGQFTLEQNFPNPFNPLTVIRYGIPEQSRVTVKVFDMLGKLIATLVDETKHAGSYEVTWDAGRVASGVYFYEMTAGKFREAKKLVLLR